MLSQNQNHADRNVKNRLYITDCNNRDEELEQTRLAPSNIDFATKRALKAYFCDRWEILYKGIEHITELYTLNTMMKASL